MSLDKGPRAVLLTEVAGAEVLTSLCAVVGVKADVMDSQVGAVAVMHDPASAPAAAAALSKAVPQAGIIALTAHDGSMRAELWSNAELKDTPPPALVLDGAPPEVEHYLIGVIEASDLGPTTSSAHVGRFKAIRSLRKLAKQARQNGSAQ